MRGDVEDVEHERRLAELRVVGLGPLLYPSTSGCAGSTASVGAPSPCGREVTHAGWRHYRMPRPRWVRLLLCSAHAVLVDDAEPATAEDLEDLEDRRRVAAYWRRVVEQNRAAARPW